MRSYIIILGAEIDGKGHFICFVSKSLIDKGIKANELCKLVSSLAGGSGGGKPDYAEGGCKDGSRVTKAIEDIKRIIVEKQGLTKVDNLKEIITETCELKTNEKE